MKIDWEDVLDNDASHEDPSEYLEDYIEDYLKNYLILKDFEIEDILENLNISEKFIREFIDYCKNTSEFAVECGPLSYLRLLLENFAREEFRVPPPLDPSYVDILEDAGFSIVKNYGDFRIEKDD